MRIVIAGGSGHLGTLLANAFHGDGHEVIVLSRNPQAAKWPVVKWDGRTLGPWTGVIDDADAVINLAGRSVDCRYHERNRREILQSRVDSTRILGRAIARAQRPPRVWLQSSTATIYAHRFDAPNDESNGLLGGDEPNAPDTWNFSIGVARAWERAADEAETPITRKVKMRTAIVMHPAHGGPLHIFLRLIRLGLGGPHGDGRQWVSWIHADDFVRAVYWLIDRDDVEGVVNVAAPHPLPNAEFMRTLRDVSNVRLGIPAPAWLLEIAAFFHRTETELLLKSRRVVPARMLREGFRFEYPTFLEAARDLVERWRWLHGEPAKLSHEAVW